MEKSKWSDGGHVKTEPAGQLRRDEHIESLNLSSKDENIAKEMACSNKNSVGSQEDIWKLDSEKIAETLALAKEFIAVFDRKYSTWGNRVDVPILEDHSPEQQTSNEQLPPFEHGVPTKGQLRPHQAVPKLRKLTMRKEVCILADVSGGKESREIRTVNGVDNDMPLPFIYISKIVYPDWFQPIDSVGCGCISGCSDSFMCVCVTKNGGEIPYNEEGAIIRAKPIVYECGPSCKCPPSCMNRVSQHGPQLQLEIFKTELRGWGVRSRAKIPSGSFICEYAGELLQDKEAEQRIGSDEYLFDISNSDEDDPGESHGRPSSKLNDDGFAIDAGKYGNLGRFINHSCSPNLYAQKVLYDHDVKTMPHIMFFATKNIPPNRELTFDYNYKMDRVRDEKGDIKTKNCYCGSGKCTGRMY